MIKSVNEKVLVKRFIEAKGLDGNIYSVYICNDIVRGIYWNWTDRDENGWFVHHSEELPTKSIKRIFGITRREFLKSVELAKQDADLLDDEIEYSEEIKTNVECQSFDIPF